MQQLQQGPRRLARARARRGSIVLPPPRRPAPSVRSGRGGRPAPRRTRTARSRRAPPPPRDSRSPHRKSRGFASTVCRSRNRLGGLPAAPPRLRQRARTAGRAPDGRAPPAVAAGSASPQTAPASRYRRAAEARMRRDQRQHRFRRPPERRCRREHGAAADRRDDEADRTPDPHPAVIDGLVHAPPQG